MGRTAAGDISLVCGTHEIGIRSVRNKETEGSGRCIHGRSFDFNALCHGTGAMIETKLF